MYIYDSHLCANNFPSWKEMLSRFAKCMHTIYVICSILVISHFGFEDRSTFLIVQVPGHCLSFIYLLAIHLLLLTSCL